MHLTAKAAAALKLPDGKTDHIEWDAALSGFGYRLRAGTCGKVLRSWVTQYRRAGGSRRITLGAAAVLSAEQARAAAKKVLAAAALGQDPQAERQIRRDKDRLSLRAVIEEYCAAKESQMRRRSFYEIKRYLLGDYFKPLHSMPIDTVTRKDVAARLVAISRDSISAAACARTAISAFFVWCMRMGMVEANPVVGTFQSEGKGRTRVLTDAELAAIWKACDDSDHGKIVKLLILTECRRQEAGSMAWSELDADAGTWTIPAERTKNGRAHTLALPPVVWGIINATPHLANRDFLFGVYGDGFRGWNGKAALDKELGDRVAPFVLHDIRRTVATRMADIGIQPHIIEAVLNHQSGHKRGVAGIYNRSSYAREVKAALGMWADAVRALVEDGERKVIPMSQATAS
jgi:integrase